MTTDTTATTAPTGTGDHEHPEEFAIVTRALELTLDKPLPGLHERSALFTEVGLDSTGVLDLLMNLEDEAGVVIDTEDLDMAHFATVGNLVSYLARIRSR